MGQVVNPHNAKLNKPHCQRCGSQWHTDCFDTDEHKEPFNGRLLALVIIASWAVVIGIVLGARELWNLIF